MIEATTKDRISITSDDDETVIMSGRMWMVYHAAGQTLADISMVADSVDEAAEMIRERANVIAAELFGSMSIL